MAEKISANRDPDWRRYPDTILRFHSAPALNIDLRSAISGQHRAALEPLGLAGVFAVITAFDPLGHDLRAEENAVRAAALESRLSSQGEHFVSVDACSPDGSHCEASVAWKTSLSAATALAVELEQMAFFWHDGNIFWIVGALAASDPIALPRSG